MSKTTTEMIQARGAALKAEHGRVAGVPVEGGAAYFRAPTADEWDEMRSFHGTPEDRKAFKAYVRACYLGALVDGVELGPESWAMVAGREGPAWPTGPAGAAVNTIAGATARAPATFF